MHNTQVSILSGGIHRTTAIEWLAVLPGLAVLYIPTIIDLARTVWTTNDQGHGPIVLAVVAWTAWQQWQAIHYGPRHPAPVMGWCLLGLGLLAYAFGRSMEILMFEVGSTVPVLAGLLLLLRGTSAMRRAWFPLLFLLFLVPLPGSVIDGLTGPLKSTVSIAAQNILYWAGYPIARSGVILQIGPYQLLVADACAGLNSILGLFAVGVFYLYLAGHRTYWRNIVVLVSLLPIAFVANVARVLMLALITYYFGDAAGQGFIHGFAGLVTFLIAVLSVLAVDALAGLAETRCNPGRRPG